MLKEISIRNFAIIDDLRIEFDQGLNLLTGETGSGKSIIIEALGILLGGRSNKNLIRHGMNEAYLEGLFFIDETIKIFLKELGYLNEENILIISREISRNQPSISRINGRPVTLSVLNKVSSKLVDIYGQYEHQSLLNIANHISLIDSFGDENHQELLSKIDKIYGLYRDESQNFKKIDIGSKERQRQIDLLKFQMDEIDEIKLSNIDEDKLLKEYRKLENAKNIIDSLNETMELLNGSDYQNRSVLDILNNVSAQLYDYKEYDEMIRNFTNRIENSIFEVQDLWNEMRNYSENLFIDKEELLILNEQIDHINKLKRKYGNNISDILNYREEIDIEYKTLLNHENEIIKKKSKIEKYRNILIVDSKKLRNSRKQISKQLEIQVTKELDQLNMKNVKFSVYYKDKDISSNGIDDVEFLISTNQGEDLKPLSKIISGGEMSRIMLAFKSITASKDLIPTLIFDEIDTGISGRTAQIVGEKINKLSESHQILLISHLPQLAALADYHYLISKSTIDKKTITKVDKLNEDDRIIELARLLGGLNLTETTLNNAKEMIEMSQNLKTKTSND